jgi:mannose/fructose/N-acetylgalactosamine-specific phosphotransferase system component IIC
VIGNVLRWYSYIFEAVLSLMALAMSAVIVASPNQTIKLEWLPWTPEALGGWLAGLGLAGLLLVLLARKLPWLMAGFALAAFVTLLRGLFLSAYRFDGVAEMQSAGWLVGGAFLAFLGALPVGSATPSRRD